MTSRGAFSDQFDPDDVPDGPEWLRHYYEDDYPDPTEGMTEEEIEEILRHSGGLDPYTMEQILEQCIKPVVADGAAHVGKLLFWCIVFRFSTQACNVKLRLVLSIYKMIYLLFSPIVRCPLWLCHLISAGADPKSVGGGKRIDDLVAGQGGAAPV